MEYLRTVRCLFEKVQMGPVVPFHPDQVAMLERQVGQALPDAYKEFLLWMGIHSGDFQRGSH